MPTNLYFGRMALLTIPEVATRLRVTRQTVHTLINRGELPRTKVGKKSFIDSYAVEAFLARNTTQEVKA